MPAECAIAVRSGASCGVLAVGRCIDCQHAYCTSHAGWITTWDGIRSGPSANLCEGCMLRRHNDARQRAEKARHEQETKLERAKAAVIAYGFDRLAQPRVAIYGKKRREMPPRAIPLGAVHWESDGDSLSEQVGVLSDWTQVSMEPSYWGTAQEGPRRRLTDSELAVRLERLMSGRT
jgi:hypothetical protein